MFKKNNRPCFIAFTFILLLPFTALAQGSGDFTVKNVSVDVQADSAVTAQKEAFDAAQIKAYEMLAKRQLSSADYENFSTPPLSAIAGRVSSFEKTNEKLSDTRYSAVYTIRFAPHQIGAPKTATNNAATGQGQTEGTGNYADNILILPAQKIDGRMVLWDDNLPFRQSLSGQIAGAADYRLATGSAADRANIRDDELLDYDGARLKRLQESYQARQTYIALYEGEGLALYEAGPRGPLLVRKIKVDSPDDAAGQTIGLINTQIAGQKPAEPKAASPSSLAASHAPVQTIKTALAFSSMREWINLKQKLERAPGLSGLKIMAISARQAEVELAYRGNLDDLRTALAGQGLSLQTVQSGGRQSYVIRRNA